jgi:hypothetical protein
MDRRRTPETVLGDIESIRTMERGRLCDMRTPAGHIYHNLQF